MRFQNTVRSLINGTYDLKNASPEFCITLLHNPNIQTLTKLHRKIQTSARRWIRDFIQANGLLQLLESIETISKKYSDTTIYASIVLFKCLGCTKELMNSRFGMEAVINLGSDHISCANVLAKACCNTDYQLVKKELFEIFSGIGMYSEKGYTICLQFLQTIKSIRKSSDRFSIVISEIQENLGKESTGYLPVLVGFINCLLSQPEDLKERLNIRFEFINLRINQIFDELKKMSSNDDLIIQIDLFEKFQHEDEDELENIFDLTVLNDAFKAVCMRNQFSANNSQQFLEMLGILFQIRENDSIGSRSKWLQSTDAIRRIVLLKGLTGTTDSSTQTDQTTQIKKSQIETPVTTPEPVLIPEPVILPPLPPPPPPPMFNAPPPPALNFDLFGSAPPPPMLAPIKINTNLICHNIPKPSIPVMPFNWQKLSSNKAFSDESIWKDINENYNGIEFDYVQLEELFKKKKVMAVSASTSSTKMFGTLERSKQEPDLISFLEAKKLQLVSIFKASNKRFSTENYIDLIRRGRSTELTSEILTGLKKIIPTKTELDEIQAFCKDNADLTHLNQADHFIKMLSDIPRCEFRINLMSFKEEFDDRFKCLDISVKVYEKAGKLILTNSHLKEFLSIVLRLGNYLNTNSKFKGNIAAFKMTSLANLLDLKNKSGFNSLHFIIEQFERNHLKDSNLSDFLADIKEIGSVLNYDFKTLTNDFNVLKRDLTELSNQVEHEETTADIKSQFSSNFKVFSGKMEKLDKTFLSVEANKLIIIKSYGEEESTFNFDEFLKIFVDFASNITKAKEENKQRAINEERAAKNKLDSDQKKSNKNDKESEGGLKSITENMKKGQFDRHSMKIDLSSIKGFKLNSVPKKN